MLDNLASVRAEPDTTIGSRRSRVLAYSVPGRSATLRVIIDAATNQMRRIAQQIDYPGLGDAWLETAYDEYAPHPVFGSYPKGHRIQLQGVDYQAVAYSNVRVNDTAAINATFAIAPDLVRPPSTTSTATATVSMPTANKLADGVFLVPVGNGDYGLAVEFRDFVLAAEASARLPVLTGIPADDRPGSSTLSEGFIKQIHSLIPSKPIRYVVTTHHHGDHAGGVRAFMAEGAAVIPPPHKTQCVHDLARARLAHNPDRFASLAHPPVRIETVADRREITDGEQTVEVISIGANPHTDEMLVLYLPRSGILFQGDLFYFDGDEGFPDPNRLPVMRAFARWLSEKSLSPSRIYGTHQRMPATMDHVRRVLAAPMS
jgi:glyoxylase-like metal-dependent hydrolase (beta-lactamase superfamily II)